MTQYDTIADQYASVREKALLLHYSEVPSLLQALGAIEGRAALDLACGDGLYTRLLRQRGARRVMGVDISPEMIRIAERIEAEQRLGIEYLACDVAEMPVLDSFDVVTAVFLLHYATSSTHLQGMLSRIHANLGEGGRLLTILANPERDPAGPNYTKYGFTMEQPDQTEGSAIKLTFHGDSVVSFHHRFWRRATYERAIENAGFGRFAWRPLTVSPEGLAAHGDEFWRDYLDNPAAVLLCCER
jgi:toxoflavin synthase